MELAVKNADIVISPDVNSIGTFGVDRAAGAIVQGYKATKNVLPKLREMISSSSSPLKVLGTPT